MLFLVKKWKEQPGVQWSACCAEQTPCEGAGKDEVLWVDLSDAFKMLFVVVCIFFWPSLGAFERDLILNRGISDVGWALYLGVERGVIPEHASEPCTEHCMHVYIEAYMYVCMHACF